MRYVFVALCLMVGFVGCNKKQETNFKWECKPTEDGVVRCSNSEVVCYVVMSGVGPSLSCVKS